MDGVEHAAGSLERLEKLLDFEIRMRSEAQQESGWTERILVAALAALVWSLAPFVYVSDVRIQLVCLQLVLAVVVASTTRSLLRTVRYGPWSNGETGRFYEPGPYIRATLPSIAGSVAYSMIAFAFLLEADVAQLLGPAPRLGLMVSLLIAIVGQVSVLVVGSFRLSVPHGKPGSTYSLVPKILSALPVIPLMCALSALPLFWLGSEAESRALLLALAAYYVTAKLLLRVASDPILEGLQALRRDLGLGRASVATIQEAYDALIQGSRFTRVVGREIAGVVEASSEIVEFLAAARGRLELVQQQVLATATVTPAAMEAIVGDYKLVVEDQRRADHLRRGLVAAQNELGKRIQLYKWLYPWVPLQLNEIIEQLSLLEMARGRSIEQYEGTFAALLDATKARGFLDERGHLKEIES